MFKNLLRVFAFIIIILILFISYLSIFGIKTNKFNEIIKSQIIKQDSRIKIDLDNVYVKLNIKEGSFSLNSKNVDIYILEESQKIENINILVKFISIFRNENIFKKIIINSKENKIVNLLKFIRTYKLNIPTLYLENSIKKGNIVYNIIINFENDEKLKLDISGKIIDANLNFLDKEKIRNINTNFNYKDKKFSLTNLDLKYKNIIFYSNDISAKLDNNLINVSGNFNNKLNLNLISSLFKYDIKKYLDEKIFFHSKSNFEISFNNNFKIDNYRLDTKIDLDKVQMNLEEIKLNNFISEFDNKIILKNGLLSLKLDKNKTEINVISNYTFEKKDEPKEFLFSYSKNRSNEKYKFYIDLSEYELILNELNFQKQKTDELFLDLSINKNKNIYNLQKLKLYNKNNIFDLRDISFANDLKIEDFASIEAKYYNKNNFFNDILIKKKGNKITLFSNNFDIGLDVEKSLKSKKEINLFDIFKNLNSTLEININSAKLDEEHDLKNLNGKIIVKNSKIDKANIFALFDSDNNFTYTKNDINGIKVTTIYSDIAKPFVKKFDFIKGFEDGKLDFTSTEVSKNLSKSELRIYDFKLKDMPALTKLLSLASLQGIADLATGQGIRFNEFDMVFDNTKNLITIDEIYALGPAISILMEGYVEKNKLVSLRGTLVPATTINRTIAKIPLLGNILVGEKAGEGVFGVSFKVKGPPNDLDTRVNPIKTLTPRFITRTLEKIKKSN